ncbi:FAD-dependent oxidoreductase [Desulfopila aestuarii]|uniref:2,4-dienoyl-CoA reductase (NADPH2) n=1 Tax=Desulfopila aestuarii DSM 18488 TaxID=1121416 RepID=A0A1M7Y5D8_9BACT|nr:FAD-dependent oxidoreductase [Desulfopila aestuarii]SHO47591.1 2,4-dienoyl-CoA reductase (NADPH2) [Desulfopila aestuarii DSM 18488]
MRDPLFQPWQIGQLTIKNRIFMPAMHLNMCKNFVVSDQLVEFYRARAAGGAGLISVGYATVDEFSGTPLNIGAHDDGFIPGLSTLATAMHEEGALCAVQLNHAGRYNASFFLGGQQPVAPSPVPSRLTRETPRELTAEEIETTITRFADAAGRVREAGFDVVEILAGTGYLISAFLSPFTNQREDEYGGSLENRMRFGIEVMRAVKKRIGHDFPLMVRINGNDFMPGGIGADDLKTFAVALTEAGVDALCINVGWHEAQVPQIVTKVPRGVFAYMAREIRERVNVPVIASHRINDPAAARHLLALGYCDAVAVGRALITDPEFPNKAARGADDSIIHCVACGQGCFDHIFKMKPIECVCNPRASHEKKRVAVQVDVPKKVMVVGGGIAGMAAALAAAERGHSVQLFEKSMRLGGQLHLAGSPPGRGEFLVFANDMTRLIGESDVVVTMNSVVDKAMLEKEQPDELILATGGTPIAPVIPGVDLPHVVQAWDILSGRRQAGRRVVVIGGGAVGVETALMLAEEGTLTGEELKFLLVNQVEDPEKLYRLATTSAREVVMVEMIDALGANFGKSTRWSMLQDVGRYGITPVMNARVMSITETGVRMMVGNENTEIQADTVVLAVGTRSENSLKSVADQLGISCTVVGDAREPGTVFEANHQGFLAGNGC